MQLAIRRLALSAAAGLVAIAGGVSAQPAATEPSAVHIVDEASSAGLQGAASDAGTLPHIIGFTEAPLATYQGDIRGLAAPPRRGEGRGRVDVASPQARAYVRTLQSRQHGREIAMERSIGRSLEVRARMQHAFNGVVADLSTSEAQAIASMPGVSLVEPYREYAIDTDVGPLHVGADTVWLEGTGLDAGLTKPRGRPAAQVPGAQGEGVVFGIIDSGVNFGSPSFAEVDMDGYRHTNPLGEGNYLGTCAPGGIDEGRCNAKLIGGYDFICTLTTICQTAGLREFPGFSDENGHGTHVASTVAGNRRMASFRGVELEISGVAPRGNVVAYDACYTNAAGQGLCPNVSTLASINQAVADGVDVINFSISGGNFPWNEANSLAFLAASDAGIFVSASGGNSGPGAATVAHQEPWVATVAAAQHGRGGFEFVMQIDGPTAPPASLDPLFLTPGAGGVTLQADIAAGTEVIVSAGIDSADDACAALPAGSLEGAIAVVRRGTCAFAVKVDNAAAAGAVAVIIANNAAGGLSPSVPGTTVPAFAITQVAGNALRDFAAANPGVTAGIPAAAVVLSNTADALAGFSSRGPSRIDVLKPDITAPGVLILAADVGPAPTGFEEVVGLKSGTSMSSPHNAGAAGLLRQLHPDWTPAEVKSAMMMTAVDTVLLQDQSTPADALAAGAGSLRVDRAARAGLVLAESTANYLAANPAEGGDPSTLNLASLYADRCIGSCSFERTFRATRANARNWDVRIEGLAGSVDRPVFNLGSSGVGTLAVEIDASNLPADGSWNFGTLVLTPRSGADGSPELRLPIAVRVPPPEISVTPAALSFVLSAGEGDAADVSVSNLGGGVLEFSNFQGDAVVAVLDQPRGAVNNGVRAGTWGTGASFVSDDFVFPAQGSLTRIRTEGFTTSGVAIGSGASQLVFEVYPDAGGVPAGDPFGITAGDPVWSYATAPNGPGLSTAGNILDLDLVAAGQTLDLEPGAYWLVVYSVTANVGNNWVWFYSAAPQSGQRPVSLTGAGWVPVGAAFDSLNGLVEGVFTCGASWITSVSPGGGSVAAGDSLDVSIGVDTDGLAPGSYTAFVCLDSNDPDSPQTAVEVSLTVTP